MVPDVAKRLLDALRAARRIREFVGDKDKDAVDYSHDALLRSAVERQFEIIGEALGKAGSLDSRVVETMKPLMTCRASLGCALSVIHGYDLVDDEIVWDVIHSKIFPLIERLVAYLVKEGYPTGDR